MSCAAVYIPPYLFLISFASEDEGLNNWCLAGRFELLAKHKEKYCLLLYLQ